MRIVPTKARTASDLEAERDQLGIGLRDFYCLLSNQSGDLAHIVAALHAKDRQRARRGVIIVRRIDADGTDAMVRDLAACGFGDDVIVVTTEALDKAAATALYSALTGKARVAGQKAAQKVAQEPSQATKDAAQLVKTIMPARPARTQWHALLFGAGNQRTPLCGDIERFCQLLKLAPRDRILCLWTRTSGKPTVARPGGGANPQFDSSNRGMAQICESINFPCTKLLIGPACEKVMRHLNRADVVLLGEYWKNAPFEKLSRLEQSVLFHFLVTVWACPVVHVGMKSGQMDGLALWGQRTVFIEDEASPTKPRSDRWTGGVLTGAFVERLPTRTGQALRSIEAKTSVKAEQWETVRTIKRGVAPPAAAAAAVNDDSEVPPPPDRRTERGFLESDRERIDAQISGAFVTMAMKAAEDTIVALAEAINFPLPERRPRFGAPASKK